MQHSKIKICKFYSQKPQTISYRGALLNTLLHATVYMFLHILLNVLVQIANKMGLQKKLLFFDKHVPRQQIHAIIEEMWDGYLSSYRC
jgi:hypothetical protein